MEQADPPASSARTAGVVFEAPEFIRRRIERALRARARYRYVHPEVISTSEGWLIVSPCCSRTVDHAGGVIDIAQIRRSSSEVWTLFARDREMERWCAVDSANRLEEILALLCADPLRIFWP